MVPMSTIAAIAVTLFVTLILPIIIYIVYGVRNKGKGVWTAWLLGAAGFFVMQIIIRSPILSILSLLPGFQSFVAENYVFYCLILAFTAALFEVVGRYGVAKLLSRQMTYERAIAAGLGHGGIESIVIVGMTYINNLLYIAMIQSGAFDVCVEQTAAMGVDTASLLAVKEALLGTDAAVFLLAGYERILTMILHTALTLVVCYYVNKKQDIKGIGICLVCHWAVDFVAPLINGLATNTVIAYGIIYTFLTVVAVVSVLAICRIKGGMKQKYMDGACENVG